MDQHDDSPMEWEEYDVAAPGSGDDEGGLSLEDLDEDTLEDESGDDPYAQTGEEQAADAALSPLAELAESFANAPSNQEAPSDDVRISPRTILEAILFVGTPDGHPLTAEEIAQLMRGVLADEIEELIEELNAEYAEHKSAFEIESIGGGYRLRLSPEMEPVRGRFYGRIKEARLSQAAIDVMAIVAYRQPVTRDEIDHLRSKPSGPLLNQLVRRQLLEVELSSERPRRRRYRTTDRFLQLFGIETLGELPQSQEIDAEM